MNENTKYKNIIFDLGAVLVNWQPNKLMEEIFKTQKERFNLKQKEDLVPIFQSKIFNEMDRGIVSREDVIKYFENDFDKNLLKEIYKHVEKHLYVLPDGIKILNKVKNIGYKTYILSNFAKENFEAVSPNYDFLDKFDGAIISYKVKTIKPELQIYKILLNTYSLEPSESLFIDDRQENIIAARILGIDGIVCKNHDFVESELKKLKII
ncbi:HAD-IA family hydrolase [Candidatus Dependentiae bacterium]|nr:HAD-IA family hydrolase [Candidatus Dependentiae bacterium]